MKKTLLFLLVMIPLLGLNLFAQNTQRGFSFQGYARDLDGAALGSQSITVRFSVYPEGSSVEYEEEQTLTTDPYGVFGAVIGSKRPVDFARINFAAKEYWLKVDVKAYGTDYVEISNTELLSVPYAKAADNGVPAGTILPFAGPKANVPPGYLACDGSQYTATDYPSLFNAIGNAWGGNGAAFNVPDLRGFFMRGISEGTNNDPDKDSRTALNTGGATGNNVGSYQMDENKSHAHGVADPGHSHSYNDLSNTPEVSDDADDRWVGSDGKVDEVRTTSNVQTNITIQNAGGNEARPKNAYVLYIIKY
jgi:microcystin-dependent protein